MTDADGDSPEGEGKEKISRAMVKLGLKLHPVESEGVKEGRESLHQTEDADCQHGPESKDNIQSHRPRVILEAECDPHDHTPQYLGQLGVGQGQSPQSEVGGSVRHRAKHVLDGVDALVDHDLAEWFCTLRIWFKLVSNSMVSGLSPLVENVKRFSK